jgi:hypothetical protein
MNIKLFLDLSRGKKSSHPLGFTIYNYKKQCYDVVIRRKKENYS